MSTPSYPPPTNTESPKGDSSNSASTGAKKTAAELVAALNTARADRAAAQAAQAAAQAASQAASQDADSTARVAAVRAAARAAARAANENKTAAKHVLHQQRIADSSAAHAAASAAKTTREAAYNAAHSEWKELFAKANAEHNACANATGDHSQYGPAIPFARIGPAFDALCADCKSPDESVTTAANNLKKLVIEYQALLAEKSEAVKNLKEKEPQHPDVVFKNNFKKFIEKSSSLLSICSLLIEGLAVCATKFVAAGFDPNFLSMFGRLFVLSSVNDSVTLNPDELPTYNSLKDKAKAGRDAFHLFCLQRAIFSFIENRLVPLIDVSCGRTIEVLMLNYKYIIPMHIHDRDAQIAEHSANIQATVEFHRQRKEQKRCKNHEATNEEFEEHFRACEEHSRQEAAEAAKSRELANSVKVFLQDPVNEALLLNLRSLGIHNNEAAWNNSNSPIHRLKKFLAQNDFAKFDESIRFLQGAGIIADERSTIPTTKNPTRQAFPFIFGNDAKSSDSEDSREDDNSSSNSNSPVKETNSSSNSNGRVKKNKNSPRIIRPDEYAILASLIAEAGAENARLDSHKSSNAEESFVKKQPHVNPSLLSPPAPFFQARPQFFLSPEDAKAIGSENGIKPETVSMVVVMLGAQSLSAALRPDVINAAKRMEAQIAAEEKDAEEKAAKKAAEKFKEADHETRRSIILARLAKMRSGSVGGGASASAAEVSSTQEDRRLTIEQMISDKREVMQSQCGGLLSRVKAASKKEAPQSAEQSAEAE